MTKRTARAQRTQAKNGAGPAPLHLVEPMLAGMTTTRQHLLAWVHAHGLAALDELFREEAVALAGPKGRHQRPRTHHHWGTAATELTFGGRRVQVRRPRVRPTIGGEATLPSVAAFRDRDPLTARMMQQLLAGVSMRDYEGSLEARLARNGQTDAAASVREGLEETLTVLKLGLPPTLRRFFATTNCIENLIGTLRHVTRNIKRWRDGDMRRRWIGLGLLRAAER